MRATEWLEKNNINLNNHHGNIGDYEGNICVEFPEYWEFWNSEGKIEKIYK